MHASLDKDLLLNTVRQLCTNYKGILSIDDNMNHLFMLNNIENTRSHHKEWKSIVFSTCNLEKYISGIIIHSHSLHEKSYDIVNKKDINLVQKILDKHILLGVKLDQSYVVLENGERLSKGIDNIREKAQQAFECGARFSGWKCTFDINIDKNNLKPSPFVIKDNLRMLAVFAKISQQYGLVPILEPVILYKGNHTLSHSLNVQQLIINELFKVLDEYEVWIPGLILKTNFITHSCYYLEHVMIKDYSGFDKESYEVCNSTLDVISRYVPQSIPAIFFTDEELSIKSSTNLLKKINGLQSERDISNICKVSQYLSFSYNHTLLESSIKEWSGLFENVTLAQSTLLEKCRQCSINIQDGRLALK